MPRKVENRISVRRDPLFLGNDPLPFDNASREELLALSEGDASRDFMSRWQETFDPYVTFKGVFARQQDQGARMLHQIKLYYCHFVLRQEWSEDRFTAILNAVMETGSYVGIESLERFDELYQAKRLPSQLRRARKNGRRL
jgi:hypothetical protein